MYLHVVQCHESTTGQCKNGMQSGRTYQPLLEVHHPDAEQSTALLQWHECLTQVGFGPEQRQPLTPLLAPMPQ